MKKLLIISAVAAMVLGGTNLLASERGDGERNYKSSKYSDERGERGDRDDRNERHERNERGDRDDR